MILNQRRHERETTNWLVIPGEQWARITRCVAETKRAVDRREKPERIQLVESRGKLLSKEVVGHREATANDGLSGIAKDAMHETTLEVG